MDSYKQLLCQLDLFIKKYYKNQLLKGLAFIIIFFIFSYLLVISIENFSHFSVWVRTFLFFLFVSVNLYVCIKFIVFPLFKLFSFSNGLTHEQAADIIGKFFPNVSDSLLNTIQLNKLLNFSDKSNVDLILASINQRSEKLILIPFLNVIQYKLNFRYLKFILPLLLILILLFVFFPSFIKNGTKRIVFFNTEFKPESPFVFELNNKDLSCIENNDFLVNVSVLGKYLPDKIYFVSDRGKFLMNRKSRLSFDFNVSKISKSTIFYFEADGFRSKDYFLKLIPKSGIQIFSAFIDYPSYTGKKDELINNVGDLYIPEGTNINFKVRSKNCKQMMFNFNKFKRLNFFEDNFSFNRTFVENDKLDLVLINKYNSKSDSLSYNFEVKKDLYPNISVSEHKDSISNNIKFFEGQLADDYGLTLLYFIYEVKSKNGNIKKNKILVDKPNGVNSAFSFAYDFSNDSLKIEDKIEYYFVVYDNDGVNGSKYSKSNIFYYELPTLQELNIQRDEIQNDINNKLSDLIKKSSKLNKDIQQFKKDAISSKQSNWEKSNALQNIQKEYSEINSELKKIQNQWNESNSEKNQLSELDKELLEKQDELQELMNQIMDQELLDLFKKLDDLLKNNQQLNELDNEKLDLKSEDIKNQLERSLEMMKRLQVNEKLDDALKELKQLKNEQDKLKDDIEKNKLSNEEAQKKQDDLNKKFDDLKNDFKEIDELNKDLKSPLNLGNQDNLKNEISQEMQNAKENLEKKKNSKASENQKNSSDKMEQLSNELESLQSQANKQQDEEDMNSIRQILESLMNLSFEQENIMNQFLKISPKDPYFKKLSMKQRKIIDDTKIVEDSLNALASRQAKIASFINKELNEIKLNFKNALNQIDEKNKKQISPYLQYVMTSYNNLALMLNESLQQMQSSMQSSSSGAGSCNKPGGKKSGSSESESQDMKSMLKKQLEQLQKGQKEGGSKPGEKPGNKPGGQNGMNMLGLGNKEIAKMAAEQTAIRQQLEKYRNELNKEGKGAGNKLNPLINELEQQEKDLINKQFDKDIIKRQKDILSRLLESEKALMERGFEDKRESKSAKNSNYSNQIRINEYNNKKLQQIEQLYSIDPLYYKYYKDKANEYFQSLR